MELKWKCQHNTVGKQTYMHVYMQPPPLLIIYIYSENAPTETETLKENLQMVK